MLKILWNQIVYWKLISRNIFQVRALIWFFHIVCFQSNFITFALRLLWKKFVTKSSSSSVTFLDGKPAFDGGKVVSSGGSWVVSSFPVSSSSLPFPEIQYMKSKQAFHNERLVYIRLWAVWVIQNVIFPVHHIDFIHHFVSYTFSCCVHGRLRASD